MNGGPSYLWAALLGLIQGAAEFLPVSSSGHLALVERLGLGTPAPAVFDVLLHLATLVVVVVFFRKTILWYAKNSTSVFLFVIVASVPTGIAGIAGKKYLEALRLSPSLICLGFLVTAAFLFTAELSRKPGYQLRDLGLFGSVTLGVCQALAIVPGISRSGTTIAGAVICGVDRKEAFAFSFILSIPAVGGAVLLHAVEMLRGDGPLLAGVQAGPLAAGMVCAAASGYAALRVLERFVVEGKLAWFGGYCLAASGSGLVYFSWF